MNEKWEIMRNIMKEAVKESLVILWGKARHKETWWWDERVETAVRVKRAAYK